MHAEVYLFLVAVSELLACLSYVVFRTGIAFHAISSAAFTMDTFVLNIVARFKSWNVKIVYPITKNIYQNGLVIEKIGPLNKRKQPTDT